MEKWKWSKTVEKLGKYSEKTCKMKVKSRDKNHVIAHINNVAGTNKEGQWARRHGMGMPCVLIARYGTSTFW